MALLVLLPAQAGAGIVSPYRTVRDCEKPPELGGGHPLLQAADHSLKIGRGMLIERRIPCAQIVEHTAGRRGKPVLQAAAAAQPQPAALEAFLRQVVPFAVAEAPLFVPADQSAKIIA